MILLLLVALPVLAGGAYVINARASNPRDEDAFIRRLGSQFVSGGCNDKTKACRTWDSTFEAVDDAFLIAEGDKACAWLEQQPYPWWRRGDEFSFEGLISRYGKENPINRSDWTQGRLRIELRRVVVARAWNDLCGAEWNLREPKNPFNKPPAD